MPLSFFPFLRYNQSIFTEGSVIRMILETQRLILREYAESDFENLYEILSDPVTMRHYPRPYDRAGTRRWLDWSFQNYRRYGFGLWAVALKETGGFIGDCGLTIQNIDGQQLPEIGYHIHKRHWRRGYAREAGLAVRDWAFIHTDYDALYSYMTAGNIPSQATARSLGMTKFKEYTDEHYDITCVCRITRQEWEKGRNTHV